MTKRLTAISLLSSCLLLLVGCKSPLPLDVVPEHAGIPTSSTSDKAIETTTPPASAPPTKVAAATPERDPDLERALDFDSEAGTRGGGYPLWVKVLRNKHPVKAAALGALNADNHLLTSATSNDDGDAQLILPTGHYRLVARRGHWLADQPVDFQRGTEATLNLHHVTRPPF